MSKRIIGDIQGAAVASHILSLYGATFWQRPPVTASDDQAGADKKVRGYDHRRPFDFGEYG